MLAQRTVRCAPSMPPAVQPGGMFPRGTLYPAARAREVLIVLRQRWLTGWFMLARMMVSCTPLVQRARDCGLLRPGDVPAPHRLLQMGWFMLARMTACFTHSMLQVAVAAHLARRS